MILGEFYEIHISTSVNKALLEYSQDHLFRYCLWLFSEQSWVVVRQTSRTTKSQTFTLWLLTAEVGHTLLEEKQALLDHRRKKLYFHETPGAWFRKTKGLDKSDTSSFCLILMLNEGAESPCHPAGQGLNSGLPMLKEAAGGQCRLPKEGLSSACPPHHSKWPLNSP